MSSTVHSSVEALDETKEVDQELLDVADVGARERAAMKIQSAFHGFKARRTVAQLGMLRLRAVKLHKATSSAGGGVRGSFLKSDARMQLDRVTAVVRIQAIFRGRQVRHRMQNEEERATKIQRQWRNWKKLRVKISAALRVKVHNFHQADLGSTTHVPVDKSFLDAGQNIQALSEEAAAIRIQGFYRKKMQAKQSGKSSQELVSQELQSALKARNTEVDGVDGSNALDFVRRSLLFASSAVADEANASIGKLYRRASDTLDEAMVAGDRAAQRASIAIGESLLQMATKLTKTRWFLYFCDFLRYFVVIQCFLWFFPFGS